MKKIIIGSKSRSNSTDKHHIKFFCKLYVDFENIRSVFYLTEFGKNIYMTETPGEITNLDSHCTGS